MSNEGETLPLVVENRGEEPTTKVAKKHYTAGSLMIMTYFWTCGGPFGIEAAVGAGGAMLTILAILVVSLLWAFPQALMAAELSLMMEVNGGNVIWVQRAFGDFIGFVNAVDGLVQNLSSQAILVVLFVEYIPIDLTEGEKWALRCGFVLATTLINIWGVQWLSRLSAVLLVIIFSPFVAQMLVTAITQKSIDFSALGNIPPYKDVHLGILISTAVWSFGGFDSIGFVAGEVSGGKRTFLLGVLGAFPLVIINYMIPIVIDYIVDPTNKNWVAGYFTQVVTDYYKDQPWLGIWVTVAAGISNFGQAGSGVATVARQVWAMAKGREEGVAQHRFLPHPLALSWVRHTGTLRPISAIIFTNIIMLALCKLPFNFLVQLYLILRILNLLLEYFALIRLRFTEPETPRPFRVPGGKAGPFLIVIPTIAISAMAVATADWEVLVTGFSTMAVIILMYPIKILWIYFSKRYGITWRPLETCLTGELSVRCPCCKPEGDATTTYTVQ